MLTQVVHHNFEILLVFRDHLLLEPQGILLLFVKTFDLVLQLLQLDSILTQS